MRKVLSAREQFDLLSPWMITADVVTSPSGRKVDMPSFIDWPAPAMSEEEYGPFPRPKRQSRPPQPRQLDFWDRVPKNKETGEPAHYLTEEPRPEKVPVAPKGQRGNGDSELAEGWSSEGKGGKGVTTSPNKNQYLVDGDNVYVAGPDEPPVGLPPKGKDRALPGFSTNLAQYFVPDELERSIMAKYKDSHEDTRASGSQWYDTANEYIHDLARRTGRDPSEVAAIVAAFSPQTSWEQNMAAANYFMMNYDPNNPDALDEKMGGLGENLKRAKRIYGADGPDGHLAGLQNGNDAQKITNFYHNLMGDKNAVTIDSWMARALMGQGLDLADKDVQATLGWKDKEGNTGYDIMANAMRSAAQKLSEQTGQEITPRELQAIIWSHVVPTAGSYKELTPEEREKKDKQRTKYIENSPNSKILPDYFHGPGWEAAPEPTYPNAKGELRVTGQRFWASGPQDWNQVEDYVRGQEYPGVTLRNELGDHPTQGYMVSVPGQEEVRPYDQQSAQPEKEGWTSSTPMSADTMQNYYDRKLPVIQQDKNNYYGGWGDGGEWFDDVSRHYNDVWDAARAAYGENDDEAQHGFYDLGTGTSPSPLEFIHKGQPAFYMARRLWEG